MRFYIMHPEGKVLTDNSIEAVSAEITRVFAIQEFECASGPTVNDPFLLNAELYDLNDYNIILINGEPPECVCLSEAHKKNFKEILSIYGNKCSIHHNVTSGAIAEKVVNNSSIDNIVQVNYTFNGKADSLWFGSGSTPESVISRLNDGKERGFSLVDVFITDMM
ncbi:hypothetical protein LJB89_02855 [Tyzzerella sp. OttesenSCG-928-J15]|nr:hypothetical protein [Tyzzerella sp. OttesenSCG-928-J15]